MRLEEVFPLTRSVGCCHGCGTIVFDAQPCEWAHPDTNEMMWPLQRGARLFCGRCADERAGLHADRVA